jgi:FkbM family methyltransferase
MKVEECCQSLLADLMLKVDPKRSGFAIDVGVGTFAFYCVLFDQLGFKTIAVEPLPIESLKLTCYARKIPLVESCITDEKGFVDLYIGRYKEDENLNLNSIRSDWWGITNQSKQVYSITIRDLVEQFNINRISCLKIDVEGVEYLLLKQLPDLNPDLLPQILIFEYGGGGTISEGKGGWSNEILADTIRSLEILQKLGYKQLILVDSENDFREKIIDLSTIEIRIDNFFSPGNVYGNIIAIYQEWIAEEEISGICRQYYNENQTVPSLDIHESLLKKVMVKVRSFIYR